MDHWGPADPGWQPGTRRHTNSGTEEATADYSGTQHLSDGGRIDLGCWRLYLGSSKAMKGFG